MSASPPSTSPSEKPSAADKYAHLMRPSGQKYVRAVTPRLRVLLYVVFGLFALLAANGIYLGGVTLLRQMTGRAYEDYFYQLMILAHLALGLLLIVPVVVFGTLHLLKARKRRNRRAVRIGYGLFATALLILISGVLLMRIGEFALRDAELRRAIYWMHLIAPLAAGWLYWLHRLAGPKIKWHIGGRIAALTGVFVVGMIALQARDPRRSGDEGPQDGDQYFHPSLARTSSGNFIAAETLMNDDYCLQCHPDVYDSFIHSAHKLSSFNNPAYLAAVRETREVALQRDGNVQASRWCAGCHDPVPFFSGAFDDPHFDDVEHPTAHAGITCIVCHSIQDIHSTRGNADYEIDEPTHYPFTYSDNAILQALNRIMVKAKPDFHKREMLKPFHKTTEFCSTCHKVHLPEELNHYKEFLRGQNHHDSFLLSGVSGHGARSFYYPEVAQENCNDCHMPRVASNDFSAKYSEELGTRGVRDHQFLGGNTALPWWVGDDEAVERQKEFLAESLRIDLFGLREGGTVEGRLIAPLRPDVPELEPGQDYLIETVLRTLRLGHHFTQGTADSNEVWIELTVRSGDTVLGHSGLRDEENEVDPWSHFVNVFMLDRHGNRIDRRNPQDIFTPLYNHQIPPGASQTVHYRFQVPPETRQPVEITARLLYRKFDTQFMRHIRASMTERDAPLREGPPHEGINPLPITVICEDRLVLPVVGGEPLEEINPDRDIPEWQRWNDYGIGMLLKGKAELRQAAEAFSEVEQRGRYDGPLNLARALLAEGDLDGATEALARSASMDPPPPPWTYAWLSGSVNRQQGNLREAAASLRSVLQTRVPERKFDFSKDYVVRNELGLTLLDLAQQAEVLGDDQGFEEYLRQAETEFLTVLETDVENATAYANLAQIYSLLGEDAKADEQRQRHQRYKPDDNAPEIAVPAARAKYPAANHAAEDLVIYDLQREGAADVDWQD